MVRYTILFYLSLANSLYGQIGSPWMFLGRYTPYRLRIPPHLPEVRQGNKQTFGDAALCVITESSWLEQLTLEPNGVDVFIQPCFSLFSLAPKLQIASQSTCTADISPPLP